MSAIGSLASTLFHAVLPINLFPNNNTASTASTAAGGSVQQPDSSRLSSFARVANTLQQLQQGNPAQYTQVTQKLAANLRSAAQSAQAGGNTADAAQLNQLATDFSNAFATGQLPNLQDLARAVGGDHGHGGAAIIQSTLTSSGIATSNL